MGRSQENFLTSDEQFPFKMFPPGNSLRVLKKNEILKDRKKGGTKYEKGQYNVSRTTVTFVAKLHRILHFTVVRLVAKPLNRSEA